MTEYESLAQEVVDAVSSNKNTTPTDEVNRLAKERGLSKEAQQRLVEETNIGLFLDKMKDGTHYEDFELANPTVIDTASSSGSHATLEKEASFKPSFDASAFCLTELPKVASAKALPRTDINEGIYNMHLKTEAIEAEKREVAELEKTARAQAEKDRQYDNWYFDIAHSIRGDADLIKTACAYFHKSNRDLVDEILHETTLTIDEIKYGVVSDESINQLSKVAAEANPTGGKVGSSFQNTLKDTLRILKYPLRNPKTALGLGATIYATRKAVSSDKEVRERQAMMIPTVD